MNGNLKPFERSALKMEAFGAFYDRLRKQFDGMSLESARLEYDLLLKDEIWVNDEYQVNVDKSPDHGFGDAEIWHLSIKRRDKQAIHDWRDLQAIKNMIVSPSAEAMELYPSKGRVVDSANQYHLWVFVRMGQTNFPIIPVGWSSAVSLSSKEAESIGATQRDME